MLEIIFDNYFQALPGVCNNVIDSDKSNKNILFLLKASREPICYCVLSYLYPIHEKVQQKHQLRDQVWDPAHSSEIVLNNNETIT